MAKNFIYSALIVIAILSVSARYGVSKRNEIVAFDQSGLVQLNEELRKLRSDLDALTFKPYSFLYTYENSVAVTLTTAETYYQITGLSLGGAQKVTRDTSSVTIERSGLYKIAYSMSASTSKTGELHGDVFLNGEDTEKISFRRDIGSANQIGSMSGLGILDLKEGDELTLWAKHSASGVTLNIDHIQFFVIYIAQQE